MSHTFLQTNNTKANLFHIRTADLPAIAFQHPPLTTDVFIQLDNTLSVFDNETIVMSLDSLSLPTSYYTINEMSNHITFVENGTTHQLTIPAQNYTARTLKEELALALNNSGSAGYTVTYNGNTNKFTITALALGASFSLTMGADGPYFAYGLNRGETHHSVGGVVVSENAMTLSPYLSLFLHLDVAGTQSYDSFGRSSDVIERVPLLYTNSLLYYRPVSPNPVVLTDKNLTSFRVRLTTDGFTPLDLNGLHWELSLRTAVIPGLTRDRFITPRPDPDAPLPDS